jgi:hypothetical protein
MLLVATSFAAILGAPIQQSIKATHVSMLPTFEEYRLSFGKTYATTDHAMKAKVAYEANLKRIVANNNEPRDPATYGVNEFTDISPDDFKTRLGFKTPKERDEPSSNDMWPPKWYKVLFVNRYPLASKRSSPSSSPPPTPSSSPSASAALQATITSPAASRPRALIGVQRALSHPSRTRATADPCARRSRPLTSLVRVVSPPAGGARRPPLLLPPAPLRC